MLTIKPIESKNEQMEILSLCGIPYQEDHFAYKAYEGDSLLAAAQFDILNEGAVIDAMRQVIGTPEDFEAMFILGRAVLNFLDLCGVVTAVYLTTTDEERRFAKLLGFREEEDGTLRITLTGLFDAHCARHSS